MDYKILAENLGLDESELFEMTELFIEVSLSDLVRLEAGLKKVDADEVVEAAHSIKGAAVNLGLQEISDVAQGVEMNARQKNLDGAPEAVQKIRDMLDQLTDTTKAN